MMATAKRILIVDDEMYMLKSIDFILSSAQYDTILADSAQRGIDVLQRASSVQQPVDLLITDIQMPGMTGLNMLAEMNKLDFHIPVLAITGFGSREIYAELEQLGCFFHIEKPFEPDDLLAMLADILPQPRIPAQRAL
jgi:two-component system, NtrC family, response regulator